MADHIYKRPYLDSGVFIAWIKGEVVVEKDGTGKDVTVDRGTIGEHVLTEAEQSQYPIIISGLTIAEVHKKKGKEKLADDENDNLLDYFDHDFVTVISVDRGIGEEANRLCRKHSDKKLSPNDGIHLACAKRAGCDVLLSWDDGLNSITGEGIRIERPRIYVPPPPPEPEPPPLIKAIQESQKIEEQSNAKGNEKVVSPSPQVPGSAAGSPASEAGAKAAEVGPTQQATSATDGEKKEVKS